MDKQKVVVVLLVIAIVMSVISVVVSVSMMGGLDSTSIPIKETIRNYFYKTEKGEPAGGGVELIILPPGGTP